MSDWKAIKKGSDVSLEGVTMEFEREDGSIKRVTITDAKGNRVRLSGAQYGNGLGVFTPAPPPMKEQHVVKATVAGLPIEARFDDLSGANAKARELIQAGVDADVVTVEEPDIDIPF